MLFEVFSLSFKILKLYYFYANIQKQTQVQVGKHKAREEKQQSQFYLKNEIVTSNTSFTNKIYNLKISELSSFLENKISRF